MPTNTWVKSGKSVFLGMICIILYKYVYLEVQNEILSFSIIILPIYSKIINLGNYTINNYRKYNIIKHKRIYLTIVRNA